MYVCMYVLCIKVQVYRSKNIDYEIITLNLKMTTAQVEINRVVLLLELGFNIRYKIEENSKTKKDRKKCLFGLILKVSSFLFYIGKTRRFGIFKTYRYNFLLLSCGVCYTIYIFLERLSENQNRKPKVCLRYNSIIIQPVHI